MPIAEITVDCDQRIPGVTERFLYIDISSVDRTTKRITAPQELLGKDAPSRARKAVRSGDVLVSMTRPNLNAVAMVDARLDGQIASTGFDVLRSPGLDSRWLYYLVRTEDFIKQMSKLVQGALYPAVRSRDVRSYIAPIAPINEQRHILDKLDALLARVDTCRERLDRVPKIIKRFRQAVLKAATSGELTAEWRIQRGVHLDQWQASSIGELIQKIEAGLNVQCEERPPHEGEQGLVKISAVTWGTFNEEESKTLPVGNRIPESLRICKGDFLISRANTLELVGACVIVHSIRRPLYLSDKVLRLVMPDYIKPWVLHVLQSPLGRKQIETLASGNQLSMRNLSQANLRQIVIPRPSDSELKEIIRRVAALLRYADSMEARYTAARAQADRLGPTILAKAFRGELVPQDPNDEPVDALLARVRATRLELGSVPKRPRGRPRIDLSKAPKEKPNMIKSRNDQDVRNKGYLAAFLRKSVSPMPVEELFRHSGLPLTDFYKQLAWEIDHGHIKDDPKRLESI